MPGLYLLEKGVWTLKNIPQPIVAVLQGDQWVPGILPLDDKSGGGGGGGASKISVMQNGVTKVVKARRLNFVGDFEVTSADDGDQADVQKVQPEWFGVQVHVTAGVAGATYAPLPIAGTLERIRAAIDGDPGAAVVLSSALGPSGGPFVAVTTGAITLTNGAAPGTGFLTVPTANNTITGAATIVELAWDDQAANGVVVNVLLGVRPSS